MRLKKVLYCASLVFLFSCPVTGLAAVPEKTYQISEEQLTQLETVFQNLKVAQNEQEQQIEMLKSQLIESETAIRQSETLLQKANESLKESAAEAKMEHDRLERQRNMWAAFALIAVGAAIAYR